MKDTQMDIIQSTGTGTGYIGAGTIWIDPTPAAAPRLLNGRPVAGHVIILCAHLKSTRRMVRLVKPYYVTPKGRMWIDWCGLNSFKPAACGQFRVTEGLAVMIFVDNEDTQAYSAHFYRNVAKLFAKRLDLYRC